MTEIGGAPDHAMTTMAMNRQVNSRISAGILDAVPNEGDILQLATLKDLYTPPPNRNSTPAERLRVRIFDKAAKNTTQYYERALQLLNAEKSSDPADALGLQQYELKAAEELQAIMGKGSTNAPKLAQWLKTETQNEHLRGVIRALVMDNRDGNPRGLGPLKARNAQVKSGWISRYPDNNILNFDANRDANAGNLAYL